MLAVVGSLYSFSEKHKILPRAPILLPESKKS
jgi:hypothetical protein